MKKILVILLCLFPASAWAGGTCVTTTESRYGPEDEKLKIVFACTADAADASMSYTLTESQMANMHGLWTIIVTTYPGATAPTDASDLAITDGNGLAVMTAAGNGINFIDATSTLQEYTEGPNGDQYFLADKEVPWTLTITNNLVNSAVVNIRFDMVE